MHQQKPTKNRVDTIESVVLKPWPPCQKIWTKQACLVDRTRIVTLNIRGFLSPLLVVKSHPKETQKVLLENREVNF